jgi:hypothetical protein
VKSVEFVKIVYRLFRYKAEWKKRFREIKIRKQQRNAIQSFDSKAEKLVVFFIPGANYDSGKESISGGLISIVSLVQETEKHFKNSTVQTICSTYYDEHLVFSLTSFENSIAVFHPQLIEKYFTGVEEIILHIPELFVERFVKNQRNNAFLQKIKSVQVNILNQNIELMPDALVINELKHAFSNCTITTAHKKYCTEFYRNMYGVPYHQLSVWISPENYKRTAFEQKENLILFSPDNRDLTEDLIASFKLLLPKFDFRIIQGLTYEEYKVLISKAKFLITTGEGLDAYFIETYFSGGVAFAINNPNFFDVKYLGLPCLFNEHENLSEELQGLINQYDASEIYAELNLNVTELLCQDYSYSTYQNNLLKFYNKDYNYA